MTAIINICRKRLVQFSPSFGISSSKAVRPCNHTRGSWLLPICVRNQRRDIHRVFEKRPAPQRRLYATFTDLPKGAMDPKQSPLFLLNESHKLEPREDVSGKPTQGKLEEPRGNVGEEPLSSNGESADSEIWDSLQDHLSTSALDHQDQDMPGGRNKGLHTPSRLGFNLQKDQMLIKANVTSVESKLRSAAKPVIQARDPSQQSGKAHSDVRIKPFNKETFEEFRSRQRQEAQRVSYRLPPGDLLQSEILHQTPLSSKYDPRLRSMTQSPTQKANFGGRTIWRKAVAVKSHEPPPALEAYQKHFQRFIDLERKEAEEVALQKLKASSGARQCSGICSVEVANKDRLDGLRVKLAKKTIKSEKASPPVHVEIQQVSGESVLLSNMVGQYESNPRSIPDISGGPSQAAQETPTSANKVAYFSLPNGDNLPENNFTRGKMVFIWECSWDPVEQTYFVPALRDEGKSWRDIVSIPHHGRVTHTFSNSVHLACSPDFNPGEDTVYRLDIGYDDTSFSRMEVALQQKLPADAKEQRLWNSRIFQGPHVVQRDTEICGTELQGLLLKDFGRNKCDTSTAPKECLLTRADQRLASWARRYSKKSPLSIDGDPDLGLNNTQLIAVARAIRYQLALIQGPPGTGKTKTIVKALSLLKKHFAVPYPILVCAHTNVAVDLLTAKCAEEGLIPLRFGSDARVSDDVRQHSFEERFARHRLQKHLQSLLSRENATLDRLKDLTILRPKDGINYLHQNSLAIDIEANANEARKIRERLQKDLKKVGIEIVKTHKVIQNDLIESSDVCLATCIGGNQWAMQTADFPVVLIDEAGQCDEPSSLIPVMKGSRHLVLIGDHKQLPSVVGNPVSQLEGLNISLFERLMHRTDVPSVMLDMQYRMVPDISAFPNLVFYDGSIRDSAERQKKQSLGKNSTVTFLDHEGEETKVGFSIQNMHESDIIMRLLQSLIIGEKVAPSSIGIISAYAAQVNLLRYQAKRLLGSAADEVEISTVDAFQGREKGIILLSTVRSNTKGSVGFLGDGRRLNVALTRAQERLIVVGNATTLSQTHRWRTQQHIFVDYIKWLRKHNYVQKVT